MTRLRSPYPNLQPVCNRPPNESLGAQTDNLSGIQIRAWPADAGSFGFGVLYPGVDPLAD